MRHIKPYQIFEASAPELTQEQKNWLDECSYGKWSVNPKTGLVDIRGSFDCRHQGLIDFKGVRFGEVGGDFQCCRNSLTSLDGAPQKVGGGFFCYSNKLTSLEGSPQSVDGDFDCSHNSLTSLEGAPQNVGIDFYCSKNHLTSLEGAPQRVGGIFLCSENVISEKAIDRVLKRMSNNSIPLEQAVSDLWNVILDEDKIYLSKHHPDLSPEEKRGYQALARLKKRVI